MRKERTNLELRTIKRNDGQLEWLPRNPRQWTQTDIDNTARSIAEDEDFLEDRPLLVTPNGDEYVVFAGNPRREGAKKQKMKTVPVVVYYPETDEDRLTVKRRAMKDNGSFGAWDYDALANEWDDLPLQDWGVPAWETQDEPAAPEVKEDDFNEDAEVETRCNPGDIWQLGEHRLMCGDSTDAAQVALLMNGAKADLSLTDPPYGIAIVKAQGKIGGDKPATFGGKIGGDHRVVATVYHEIKGDETTDTARLSYEIMKDVSRNQVIFGGNYFTDFLPPKPCWVVWDKMNGDSVFADVELAWTSFDHGARLYQWLWNGMSRAGDRKTEGDKRMHPTQKPVGLFAKIIEEFSKEGETILDLFAGSGCTVIASEQTKRVAYLMEYEPHYCDVIISRWETFTGKTAQLITPGGKVS